MLATAETIYGPRLAPLGVLLPPDRHAEYPLALQRAISNNPVIHEPASDEVAGAPVEVRVNHGRWVVECPGVGCGDAQVASRDDHRFFCITCGNPFVAGRWVATVWPDDVDGIDAALSVRPETFRNWHGESVDDLLRDNADPVNGL